MRCLQVFLLFILVLVAVTGCQTVNVCVDDGFCSSRELANGKECNDCIQGPFIPKSLAGLSYFSQVDIEDIYGANIASDVATNYIGVENPNYVLYADSLTAVLDQLKTKSIVILAEHGSKASAQETVDFLIGEKYNLLNWSLNTHEDYAYYEALRNSSNLFEVLNVVLADTSVYLIVSENNYNYVDVVSNYVEVYASEQVVETQVLVDTSFPRLLLPQGVNIVVSNVTANATSLNGSDVFRILDIEPSEKITNVKFSFQLPKSWVDARVSMPSKITTLLSDDGFSWEDIHATYLGEFGDFYKYETLIPHFSKLGVGSFDPLDFKSGECVEGVEFFLHLDGTKEFKCSAKCLRQKDAQLWERYVETKTEGYCGAAAAKGQKTFLSLRDSEGHDLSKDEWRDIVKKDGEEFYSSKNYEGLLYKLQDFFNDCKIYETYYCDAGCALPDRPSDRCASSTLVTFELDEPKGLDIESYYTGDFLCKWVESTSECTDCDVDESTCDVVEDKYPKSGLIRNYKLECDEGSSELTQMTCDELVENSYCGDNYCDDDENEYNCPVDCGEPDLCGNAICDEGEDYNSCPADCSYDV